MIKIGVLADTHGFYDPQIPELFAGVDHILHGGDIGLPWLILELEDIAPVTAVTGNSDAGIEFKETEIVELDNRRFLLHHIVDIHAPASRIKSRIIRENPDVVIFGHSHQRFCQAIGDVLYLNPGYAGEPKGDQERTVAILTCDESGMTADFLDL